MSLTRGRLVLTTGAARAAAGLSVYVVASQCGVFTSANLER
jgi:hypothetical protein